MTPRAAPLPPEVRRQALVEATLPLLRLHGRAITSRQIAEAAGVAEGTIFRVFESKDELVEAAVASAFRSEPFLAELEGIDPDQPMRARLLAIVTVMQDRFREIFGLMHAMGMVAPPGTLESDPNRLRHVQRATAAMVRLLESDQEQLRIPVEEVLHYVRLLTFAGTHEHLADGRTLAPDDIVDLLLDGVRRRTDHPDDGKSLC